MPTWNIEHRHALKLLCCPDKAIVAKNGLWSIFINPKMDEVSETKSQYAHCRHITVMSFVSILRSVDQTLMVQYGVSVYLRDYLSHKC